jgi:hypothetical protein
MSNLLPSFIIIGAGKSGTTALHHFLSVHPEVFMTPVKETNFFELEGLPTHTDPADDPDRLYHYPQSINNWSDYKALFAQAIDVKAIGEASPMYLYGKRAPQHIHEKLPNVKLIAILREPVDRLYSRWLHLLRDGNDPIGNFEGCLNRDSIWWKRNDLVQEGFYGTHLARYVELFPNDQLKIFLHDDLKHNSSKVMKELFDFIGVDSSFQAPLEREYNVSGKPKNSAVDRLIGSNSFVIQTAKKIAPSLVDQFKDGKAKQWLTNLRKKNMDRPTIDKAFKQQLFNEVYADEIDKLEQLIGRDLSHWKTKYGS